MTGLPLLDLGADPRERGLVHGRALAAAARDNIETYLRRFEAGGLDRDSVLAEGGRWAKRIAGFDDDYAAEIAGIAEGAGLPLASIAMLNARYEIAYGLFAREAKAALVARPDACTTFGALPEATRAGTVLIGQNWDWLARVRGRLAMLRIRPAAAPAFLCITQAGIAGGMIGLNEAGLGLCVNGLTTDADGDHTEAKPFHLRVREILLSEHLCGALKVILESDRVCSANFLLGHGGGEVIDIEAAPRRHNVLYPDKGLLTHANHFVVKDGIESTMERLHPSTLYRAPRLARLLGRHRGGIDPQIIEAALKDHFGRPYSICRHADEAAPEAERILTATSVILALDERVIYASDGPPCENPYRAYRLAA